MSTIDKLLSEINYTEFESLKHQGYLSKLFGFPEDTERAFYTDQFWRFFFVNV